MPSDSANGTPPGPQRPRDRRATYRAAIEIPAILLVGDRRVNCRIRDLSTRGIALVVGESLAPGMVVQVAFRLPNSRQPVSVSGTLTRQSGSRSESVVALEFVEPEADVVRTIATFVRRNRSDRPFSHQPRTPDTASAEASDEAALRGLYQRAVDNVREKPGRRRGLLARLLRRDR